MPRSIFVTVMHAACPSLDDLSSFSCPCLECALLPLKANFILGCINTSIAGKSKEVNLPIYLTLMRAHLEYHVHFWDTLVGQRCC